MQGSPSRDSCPWPPLPTPGCDVSSLCPCCADLLRRSAPARIVNVSSFKHKTGKIDLQELTGKKPSNVYHVYSSTKLMNILFTNELARRLQGTGLWGPRAPCPFSPYVLQAQGMMPAAPTPVR